MKDTMSEKIFYILNYFILTIAGLCCLFPLLHIVALSLSGSEAVMSGKVSIWPVEFSIESYLLMLKGTSIVNAFKNSILITLVGVLLSMTATILAAYPLSRKYFYARNFFTMLIVFTMLFRGGLIPSYLVVKSLGLVNNYGSLWLPGLISTYNMLVLRTFFQNIPEELEEAARMDGCSEVRLIIQIFLPLSLPCIVTLCLFYAVGYWNSFMNVLIYINETSKFNLSVLVNQMIRNQSLLDPTYIQAEDISMATPEGIRAAGIMVMVVPMLLVYPFLQRFFVKGVMLGSVKG